jgi:hypothetical protein
MRFRLARRCTVLEQSFERSADVLVGMRMEKLTWEPECFLVLHAFSGRRGRHPGAPTSSSACEWKSRERRHPRRHANGKANGGAGTSFRCPRILRATGTSPGSADVLVGMRMEKPTWEPERLFVGCAFSRRRGRHPGAPTSSSACEWKSQRGSRNVFSLAAHSLGDGDVTWERRRPRRHANGKANGGARTSFRCPRILRATGTSPGSADVSSACEWKS